MTTRYQLYSRKDFFDKKNIKTLYSAIREYFKTTLSIDIQNRYINELRDVMIYVYDQNNKKPEEMSDQQYRILLNKEVMREITPFLKQQIQQPHIVDDSQGTPTNIGLINAPSDIVNAQYHKLRENYQPRNNTMPNPPNFMDDPANDPRFSTDPRFASSNLTTKPENLLNNKLSERQQDIIQSPIEGFNNANQMTRAMDSFGNEGNRPLFGTQVAYQPEILPTCGQQQPSQVPPLDMPTQTESVCSIPPIDELYDSKICETEMGKPNLKRIGNAITSNTYTIPPFDQRWIPRWSRYQVYDSQRIPEMLAVDSRQRSDLDSPSKYKYFLSQGVYKNVVSVQLIEACVPKSDYLINDSNNYIYFEETPGVTIPANIPVGNYATLNDIMTALVAAMNSAGGSTYTFTIDTLTGKVTIISDGAGGTGIFNLIFAGTTMNIGAGTMTMYKPNSIGPVIGFSQVDLSASLSYTAQNVPNLSGDCYILLFIDEFDKYDSSTSSVSEAFAKIDMDAEFGDVKTFTDARDYENIRFFSPPLGKLSQLNISWRRYDGSLYNFNGRNHSMLLEIICVDDEHRVI